MLVAAGAPPAKPAHSGMPVPDVAHVPQLAGRPTAPHIAREALSAPAAAARGAAAAAPTPAPAAGVIGACVSSDPALPPAGQQLLWDELGGEVRCGPHFPLLCLATPLAAPPACRPHTPLHLPPPAIAPPPARHPPARAARRTVRSCALL